MTRRASAHDTLAKLLEYRWGTTETWAGKLIEQLAEQGHVIVPCPPGERVVVDHTTSAVTVHGLDNDCFLNADAGDAPGLFDANGERLVDGGMWVALIDYPNSAES